MCLWLVVSLQSSDVHTARSLSVLDSKLLQLYQKYRQPYDIFEPGFAADPDGYEARNALQPNYAGEKTIKDAHHGGTFKAGPGQYDDGYHTQTVPYHHHHHDPGGYATQNAFQPHYSGGKHKYDGYHTKTVGFPLYQDYQPIHISKHGYATRTAYHPYRSRKQHKKLAETLGPGKHHSDDGYHTRTSELIPLYQDEHHYDPGGYATVNAFQPYRSAVNVGGPPSKLGHERRKDDREYVEDRTVDEDRFVHRFYSNDDDDDDDDDDDAGVWSTQRPSPAAHTDYSYSTNVFVHKPT